MSGTTRAARRGGRPAAGAPTAAPLLALACCVVAGAAGCQTFTPRKTPAAAQGQKTAEAKTTGVSGPAPQKTDFRREVTPLQQFNVHLELGRVHETQGNFEAAVAEYQKAVEAAERRGGGRGGQKVGAEQQALAQRRMAGAFDRMGRFTQADVHYQQALKLAPRDPKVWNDIGYSYYLQNRWSDAERALKTAETMEPNNPRVLTNLGLALAAQGKDDEALTALSRANGPAAGHANLGFILAAQGKSEQARRHYEHALALQPQLTAARDAIARIDAGAKSGASSALASAENPRPVPPGATADAQVALSSAAVPAPATPTATPPMPSRTLPGR